MIRSNRNRILPARKLQRKKIEEHFDIEILEYRTQRNKQDSEGKKRPIYS